MSDLTEEELVGLPNAVDRKWIRACAAHALPEDGGYQVDTTPPVSVFVVAGEFFCIDDTCTHAQISLADGFIEGRTVECWAHGARFDLATGQALTLPADRPLTTRRIEVHDGMIYVT